MTINYDKFGEYLKEQNITSWSGYKSLLKGLIKILNEIDEFKNIDDLEKLKIFLNKPKSFKNTFDNYHEKNKDTFDDSRSVAKKYIEFSKINDYPLPNLLRINLIKNIILYGSPGVGKTHNTNKLIKLIEEGKSDKEIFESIKANENSDRVDIDDIKDRVKFVTFHQSFGYEDFIEGFRPNVEGNIVLSDGIFKTICQEANEDKENSYYLVIDEINRGNISKIFGELITLLEEDKRDKLEVTQPYSKKPFKIPSNLYVIGTMNSTDKSIALIDIALRRRFTFLKMKPNAELVPELARELFEKLNRYIRESHLGEDYQIGHSYFMGIKDHDDLDFVWEYKIKPLLEEYFYGDKDGLEKVLKIVYKKEYVNEDLQEPINGDDLND